MKGASYRMPDKTGLEITSIPGRKKKALCQITPPNCLTVLAYFNTDSGAKAFMEQLEKMILIKEIK